MAERNEGKPIASPDDTFEVVLSLARAGWYVFPVNIIPVIKTDDNGVETKTTDKRPLVKWHDGASRDPEQIATWWAGDFPGAWIGVHAQRSGIVVVDLDKSKPWPPRHELAGKPKGDGRDNLKAAGIKLPKTLAYKTRSGGTHHVYRAPDDRVLTIAQDVPVPSVDIRAGVGLMVYYGPELGAKPDLAPAPEWACIDGKGVGTSKDRGGESGPWFDRQVPGTPAKPVRKALKAVSAKLTHEPMLAAVSELVKLGSSGMPGVDTALAAARATYIQGRPDRARDWDNAVEGSIRRHGLPPVTLEIPKAERKTIAARNNPEAIEAVELARKAEYRVAKHHEAAASPTAGVRILEDGPLAAEFAPQLATVWAYATGLGLMRYDGKRWAPAEEHSLVEACRRLLESTEIAEHDIAVRRGDNKAIDKARTLLSRGRAYAVARLIVGILAEIAPKFDANPDVINTPTGLLDLRTLELSPHEPGHYVTKMTGVGYDPEADVTLWMRALEAVPKSVRPWLQERFGQALTGHTPDDDVLIINQGGGHNGKTTVLNGTRKAFGDYGLKVSDKLLNADPSSHPTELMDLKGARFAIFEELPEGRQLNVKRLKDTVGTPEITAHYMRQDNITFEATHALAGDTNYMPIINETDWGTWRRLALVVFPYRYIDTLVRPNDRPIDSSVRRQLAKPNAGVLRWLAEGAKAWYDNDMVLTPREEWPKPVARATEAWRLEADPVLAYVTERLVRDDGYAIATADLARDFNEWLESRGHKAWSQQTLNARFAGHTSMDGIERKMVKFSKSVRPSRSATAIKAIPANTTAWRGIKFESEPARLKSEAERDADAIADLERRMHK